MYKRMKTVLVIILCLIILMVVVAFAIGIGQTYIDPQTVLTILLSPLLDTTQTWSSAEQTIITEIRLPRVILAASVGCGLAISGTALQSLFRNPMADPFILGISNGAALGATIIILYGTSILLGKYNLPFFAFTGSLITVAVVYQIARTGNKIPVNTLLLSGIAISAFLSAVTSFIMFTSNSSLNHILFWMMGGLSGRGWDYVWMCLPFTLIGCALILMHCRDMNVMMFGEESAQYLGVNVEKIKKRLLITAAIITGAAVAVSGVIGFVGLIIPHIIRLIVGPDHRVLLPVSAICGALFLVSADLVARIIIAPAEMPLGVITAMIGGPFFLYLLKSRKGEL